jgi:nucleoid-associated protein YgaU
VTDGEPDQVHEAAEPARSRAPRAWLAGGGLVLLAALGAAIGVWLGLRQSGPLANPVAQRVGPTIVIGTIVSGPPAAGASVVASPSPVSARQTPTAAPVGVAYVVKEGDTLRSIAQSEYGDAEQWPKIYQANRDTIGADPDALRAGMTLDLPPPDQD